MQTNRTKFGWIAGLVAVWLAGLATVQAADFTSWAKKMPIQFTGYTRSETLTNFPALVTFTNGMASGFSYADFLSTNADLRFTPSWPGHGKSLHLGPATVSLCESRA
jgi:hypothetical protein